MANKKIFEDLTSTCKQNDLMKYIPDMARPNTFKNNKAVFDYS